MLDYRVLYRQWIHCALNYLSMKSPPSLQVRQDQTDTSNLALAVTHKWVQFLNYFLVPVCVGLVFCR